MPDLTSLLACGQGALHGLLCEELPLRATIEADIVEWITERADEPPTAAAAREQAGARP